MQVAIKKVLQDKRFKNRELQIMKMMDHPNVVDLQQCFYTNEKNEVRWQKATLSARFFQDHSPVHISLPSLQLRR